MEAETNTTFEALKIDTNQNSNNYDIVQTNKNEKVNTNNLEENFDITNLDGSLSPTSLRRSTRVCALNAQKKIKREEIMVDIQMETLSPNENGAQTSKEIPHVPVKKLKRKIESGEDFDQFDCKFGIRLDEEGEVVSMSGSEISSLNEESVAFIRKKYSQIKKFEVNDEIKFQRHIQIHNLEEALRLEEAKLCMLKKIRQNQQENHSNENKILPINITQNSDGNTYKPAIAASTEKINGTSKGKGSSKGSSNTNHMASWSSALTPQNQQVFQALLAKSGHPHIAQLLRNLPPGNVAAWLQQHAATQQQQQKSTHVSQQANVLVNNTTPVNSKTPSAAAVLAHEAVAKARETAQNNAQKVAAARMQMKRQLEQQLTQVPAPKAPVPDLSFIPSGTHPDFLYMLGLDLTVQRVLKDKNVFKKMDFDPYVCEECSTDFTPSWKAISGVKGDYHLYCEQCVRQTQKRQIRQDHTLLLKKVFQKNNEQEKEFEKQVAAGKFTDPIPSIPQIPPVGNASITNAVTPKTAVSSSRNSGHHASPANVSGLNSHSNTPTNGAANHFAQTPTGSANSASSSVNRNNPQHINSNTSVSSSSTNNNSALRIPQATSSKPKRTSNQNSSTANSTNSNINAATLAALQNNSLLSQQLAFNALRQNSNSLPLMAAMMSNPNMMFQQLLAQQMLNQRGINNNNGMAALVAAAQQSSQQQNNSSPVTQQQQQQQNTSNNNSINQLLAANLMSNPQLLRQVQQAQMAQQMRDLAAKSSKK